MAQVPSAFEVLSLIINVAVAVGTLSLAWLAFKLSRRENESREAQVMAERIYLPIRPEVITWANPMEARFTTWKFLKDNATLWSLRVPGDLADLLNEAEPLFERIGILRFMVRVSVQQELDRQGAALAQGAAAGVSTVIRLTSHFANPLSLDLTNAFVTRKKFDVYVLDLGWDLQNLDFGSLEVLVGGFQVGQAKEAREIGEKVLLFLENRPEAVELRDKLAKVKELGEKTLPRIDAELKKPPAS